MSEFERIASVDDVQPGERISVEVDDIPALLIRVGDEYFAIEDVCTHDGNPLTDGPVEGEEIICPRHGARFNVKSGDPVTMPATQAVETFEVEVRDGAVYARPRD